MSAFTVQSFPTIPEVLPHENHPHAESILDDLKKNNEIGYNKLQSILTNHALDMIDYDLNSKSIKLDPNTIGVKSLMCHVPINGTRVLRVYSVDNPTWTKVFTGNYFRVDTVTLDGEMGKKSVEISLDDNLIIDMAKEVKEDEEGHVLTNVTVTNISITNDNNDRFGENKRPISMPHLVAVYGNPDYMKDKFLIKNKVLAINEFSTAKQAIEIAKNGIMPVAKCDSFELYQNVTTEIGGNSNIGYNLAFWISPRCHNIHDKLYICTVPGATSTKRNGIAIVIQEAGKDIESWATNPEIWQKLLPILGQDICQVK